MKTAIELLDQIVKAYAFMGKVMQDTAEYIEATERERREMNAYATAIEDQLQSQDLELQGNLYPPRG